MDGGKGQLVVLHGVHLAVEQLRGEVEAARHRQTGVLEAIAHGLGQQQAVGPGAHHHIAGGDLFPPRPHQETLPLGLNLFHLAIELQVQLPGAASHSGLGLGHKGFS